LEYPKKVWVIDVPLPFPFGSAHIRRETPAPPPKPTDGGVGAKPESKSKSRGKAQRAEADPVGQLHSRWHIVFAYVLGPLYPLLTRWSIGNIVWAVLGLASIAACVGAVWYRTELLRRAESGGFAVPHLLAVGCGIVLLSFTAWARALYVAGWRMQQRSLLVGLSHPITVAGLSLVFPGLGLFISGNPRRGALAVWILGPLMIALVILIHAPWLWHLNQNLVAGRVPRSALELVFIASLLLALLATFTWVVQALEGARLVSRSTGRVSHGQPVALALLVAIVAFHLTFEPARIAQVLDRFAIAFRLDGLRVIPLVMELGAAKLDPVQPLYPHRAAELYQQLGQRGRARHLREELNARWNAYARTVRSMDPVIAAQVSRPIQPSIETETLPIPEAAISPFASGVRGGMDWSASSSPEAESTSPEAATQDGRQTWTWTWTAD